MEIKFHSMKERPVRSCEVIVQNHQLDLIQTVYSVIHAKFNVQDNDSPEEAKSLSFTEDLYNGWIYTDELRWQMARCADEVQ